METWYLIFSKEEQLIREPHPVEISLERKHYHVTTISPQINIPAVITNDIHLAMLEYAKMVNLVGDLTGLKIIRSENQITLFDGGTAVRWFECVHDCAHWNLLQS